MAVSRAKRDGQVLSAIAVFTRNNDYSPTYRDLSEVIGISHSAIFEIVARLRDGGMIRETPRQRSRAIVLTAAGYSSVPGRQN